MASTQTTMTNQPRIPTHTKSTIHTHPQPQDTTEVAYPLGLFVGGFRWSGSGAVSDWLAGHQGLCQLEGCEASFGEIRAINYGLRYLAQTAAGTVPWGERLGRWALCPEPRLWKKVLGTPLTARRGPASALYSLADRAFTSAARFRIIPGLPIYKPLLDTQLGRDFTQDAEYLNLVSAYAASLHGYLDSKGSQGPEAFPPWQNPAVRKAASAVLGLFYRRLTREGRVPIFDNAFSGLNPELLELARGGVFKRKLLLLVRRDPRDQFVDLVRFSGSTFSWSVGGFIRQYRKAQEKTARFLAGLAETKDKDKDGPELVRVVGFEEFVLDRNGARTALQTELCDFWSKDGCGPAGNWLPGSFRPEQSARNIGLWRASALKGAIQRICRELPEFLVQGEGQ
jgi:hypothetical protein